MSSTLGTSMRRSLFNTQLEFLIILEPPSQIWWFPLTPRTLSGFSRPKLSFITLWCPQILWYLFPFLSGWWRIIQTWKWWNRPGTNNPETLLWSRLSNNLYSTNYPRSWWIPRGPSTPGSVLTPYLWFLTILTPRSRSWKFPLEPSTRIYSMKFCKIMTNNQRFMY